MMLDRIAHGRAASPVSSTTAVEVSSQDVLISSICMVEGLPQRLCVRRPEDAALRDDAGNVLIGRHIERRVPHERALGRKLRATDMRDLASISLLDWNV